MVNPSLEGSPQLSSEESPATKPSASVTAALMGMRMRPFQEACDPRCEKSITEGPEGAGVPQELHCVVTVIFSWAPVL